MSDCDSQTREYNREDNILRRDRQDSELIQRMSDFDTQARNYTEAQNRAYIRRIRLYRQGIYNIIMNRYTNGKHSHSLYYRREVSAHSIRDYVVERSGGKVTCKISKFHDILSAIIGDGWTFYHVKFTF